MCALPLKLCFMSLINTHQLCWENEKENSRKTRVSFRKFKFTTRDCVVFLCMLMIYMKGMMVGD